MKRSTLALAYVWLMLAVAGGFLCVMLIRFVAAGPSCSDASAYTAVFLAAVFSGFLLLFWVAPLGAASVGLLRGRAWGWHLLRVHASITAVAWAFALLPSFSGAVGATRDRIEHGPHWGGFPEAPLLFIGVVAFLLFTAHTIRALLADRPEDWQ